MFRVAAQNCVGNAEESVRGVGELDVDIAATAVPGVDQFGAVAGAGSECNRG
jgi:citrate lyase alpha subunit